MSTGSGEAAARQEAGEDAAEAGEAASEAGEDAAEGLAEREAETVSEFGTEDIADVQELDEDDMPSAKKTKFLHHISDSDSEATPRR